MNTALLIFLCAFSVFSIAATVVKCKKHRSYMVLKPIPMLMLIGFLIISVAGLYPSAESAFSFRIMILCGLLLGLAGDMFLLNSKRFFIHGLVFFLLGHIAYIAAFVYASGSFSGFAAFAAVPCILYFGFFITKISAETKKKFLPAIAAYFLVITVMAVSAFSFDAGRGAAVPAFGIAAAIFCISDASLAWGIFVRESLFNHAAVLLTYYIAQLIIAFTGASLVL